MLTRMLTVSQLNRMVAAVVERELGLVAVEGEISNFVRAASGHWYFVLKDGSAQVRCVMFRTRNRAVDFPPRDGDRIELRAWTSLYEARGEFQLNVEALRRAGAGDLYRRFLELKARLEREGLFDPARKRSRPAAPARIGVVTSTHGAALRDVLSTLRRRAPALGVIVYPTPVQGVEAPAALVAAIEAASRRRDCDLLLLVRGGGSIEDLWAFNDEAVARAIAACELPIVSGVGHETDFTIADFVADLRAPTPTAAAELAAPDRREQQRALGRLGDRLTAAVARRLERAGQRIDIAARGLRPPLQAWNERRRRLAEAVHRLCASADAQLLRRRVLLGRIEAGLRPPRTELARQRTEALALRLNNSMRQRLGQARGQVQAGAGTLELVSPSAVLARGFAIVRDENGAILRDADLVSNEQMVSILLERGELDARVQSVRRAAGPQDRPAQDHRDGGGQGDRRRGASAGGPAEQP